MKYLLASSLILIAGAMIGCNDKSPMPEEIEEPVVEAPEPEAAQPAEGIVVETPRGSLEISSNESGNSISIIVEESEHQEHQEHHEDHGETQY